MYVQEKLKEAIKMKISEFFTKKKRGSTAIEDTPISFIIIHDGIKDVVVNRKSEL